MTRFPALVLVALSLLARPVSGATIGIKLFRSYVSPADGSSRDYTIRTPAGYDGATKLPAVLFLHGRGGTAMSFQYQAYLDAADANGYVLIFWQGRIDPNGLLSTYYVDAANGIPDETDVLACLDDALAKFAIDPSRVHLVGFSQGGKGALLVGLKNPDRFASVTSGAGPSDAFEGQKWSPTFPDFRQAAGGDPDAGGAVLARWFGQSARFLLPNARNTPLAFAHGALDDVVPDSTLLFPYRNTHHVADTPGFADERGTTPTLAELHAQDPGGYPYETRYVSGVGHDELGVLAPAPLFASFAGRTVVARPARVTGVTFDAKERSFWWARLGRTTAADGTAAPFTASIDGAANALAVSGATSSEAAPRVRIDLPRAGLDASRRLTIDVSGRLVLVLTGVPDAARLTRDGTPVPGLTRDAGVLTVPLMDGAPATLVLDATPTDLLESDLLVPALVESDGRNGAHFSTELSLANLGDAPASLEALLLDGTGRATSLDLPARSSRALTSAALFARLGAAGGVAPLRLRVSAGDPRLVVASSRVFNTVAAGTYGLSFPVRAAGASVVAAGGSALFFGGSQARPERVNVSVFAPFEDASGTVTVVDDEGVALRSVPFALARLQRVQLDDVLAGTAAGTTARVAVASGRVQTYATVVSSSPTNDPFRSPPLAAAAAARTWTVPTIAAAAGRLGALFTSDLYLSSPIGAQEPELTLTFHPHGGGTVTVPLALESGETRLFSDVLDTLFPSRVPDYGALTISSTAPVHVLAVTRADAPSGASSQDLPCVAGGDEITSDAPAAFAGLAETPLFRTNLTLVNAGDATSVTLALFAEDGSRGTVRVSLAAGEFRQLDSVVAQFAGGAAASAALLITPDPGGRVVASAARIDNGTNDPTGLSPASVH